MSNEIFDKDKENELIGKQKKHLNKKRPEDFSPG